jgi:fatty-acyl-CoA synthase
MARAAHVYPNHLALVHGEQRYTWAESYARARRIASALVARGIKMGDTVSVMGFNTPETFELHFAVPVTGAVLHAINIRLDAKNIAFMLEHAETKILFSDRQASPVISQALKLTANPPLVIDIDDPLAPEGDLLGDLTYNDMLAQGDPAYAWQLPADEWQAISLNYTSGTTGNPKGVVYHHRGAYLNAVSNALTWDVRIPAKMITDSGACRSVRPVHADRSK